MDTAQNFGDKFNNSIGGWCEFYLPVKYSVAIS